MTAELFLVDAHSLLGQQVDPEPLLSGIRSADMPSIEANDIATHDIGLFLTEGIGKGAPAVGYVACKGTHTGSLNHELDIGGGVMTDAELAEVGSLYLPNRYRGRGIGRLLVNTITDRTFTKHPLLLACTANCNQLSAPAFKAVGYIPGATLRSGKISHQYQRADWVNS